MSTQHKKLPCNFGLFASTVMLMSTTIAAPAMASGRDETAQQEEAQAVPTTATDPALIDLSIEDLMALEVTSVAKKRQKVSDASAAVFVISQDDIRRSTAKTIPDLLRMVPGLEVAEILNGGTAVAARGFNSRFANSLLVMIDGRAIYLSSVSGVLWDHQLIPLTDIERIEVVRGPGATLWGSNAVNAVINIISKHPVDTLGNSISGQVSSAYQQVNASHGARVGESLTYRIYGNFRRNHGLEDAQGNHWGKAAETGALGTRIDIEPNDQNALTLQAEYAKGTFDSPMYAVRTDYLNPGYDLVVPRGKILGVHLLGRWAHKVSDDLEISTQAYVDRARRTEFKASFARDMADLDIGVRWRANPVHEINFGIGGRLNHDSVNSTRSFGFLNDTIDDRYLNAYIQDDISIVPDKLRVTIGTKAEVNNFTGFELQPSARIFYRANPNLAFWGAVSRAIRTPARFERDALLYLNMEMPGTPKNPGPLPIYGEIKGNPDLSAENVIAFELGMRGKISQNWAYDLTAYHNRYRNMLSMDLVGIDPIMVPPIPYPVGLQAHTLFGNHSRASSKGFEASLSGRLTKNWRVDLAYSYLDLRAWLVNAPPNSISLNGPNNSPKHQAMLRTSYEVNDKLTLNSDVKYVSTLPNGLNGDQKDFNVGFRATYAPIPTVELSLIGTDLLQKHRMEISIPGYPTPQAYVPRSLSVQARVRF